MINFFPFWRFFIIYFLFQTPLILNRFFYLDYNLFFIVSIFFLLFSILWFSPFNFVSLKEFLGLEIIFFFVFLFLFFSFSSNYIFWFIVFLEMCVIFLILLIFWYSKDLDKISSIFFMFFINICPSILFIFFRIFIDKSFFSIYYNFLFIQDYFLFFCYLGLLFSKLPLFFFHFWLTKAHVRASGCGSIILASLMLKIGSVGLYKSYYLFIFIFSFFSFFSFSIFVVRIWFLLLIILRFFDIKYIIACSSIVHMAPISFFCLWGERTGVFSRFLIIVGHGLISYYIFFLVSLIYEMSYNRSSDFNKGLESISKSLIFFVYFFFLSNIGFPPIITFLREIFFLFSSGVYRIFFLSFFLFSLLIRGMVFFFVVSKLIFGKKLIISNSLRSSFIFFFSLVFLFFFLILVFFI